MMAWDRRTSIVRKISQMSSLAGMAGALLVGVPSGNLAAQQQAPVIAPATKAEPAKKTKAKSKAAADEAKAVKKDPAVAQQQVDAGVASLQAGKADLAVQQLTAAIAGGGLPPALMARAQYHRGLAYRKQSKPALAISDLTQALWIKSGLNEADRADALQNRIAAYRDAGLPDQDDAESVKSKAASKKPAGDAPVAVGGVPASPSASTGSISAPPSRPSASLAPATETAPTQSNGGGVGGFFGNLFGGSGSSANAAPAPSAPVAQPKEAASSAWSSGTEVKPATAISARSAKPSPSSQDPAASPLPWQKTETPKAATVQTAAVAPAAVGAGPARGKYVLQVARLKTPEEAQAVATKLKQQLPAELAGREAAVVAVNAGGFGTLHQVTFGPFADPAEWKAICPKLLSAGHDCQPLTK
jgi:SPOR domain